MAPALNLQVLYCPEVMLIEITLHRGQPNALMQGVKYPNRGITRSLGVWLARLDEHQHRPGLWAMDQTERSHAQIATQQETRGRKPGDS